MTATAPDLDAHRAFLNRYYRWSRPVYDLTRRYYLLGRDAALGRLLAEPWRGLVEIGPGTGRNLEILRRGRPEAALGGVEACDEMLAAARRRVPTARIEHGFAEQARYGDLLAPSPVDRVLFSYSLSMIPDRQGALDRALEALAPGGEVVVVDFADLTGLPGPMGAALRTWLGWFHVAPLDTAPLEARGATLRWGPGRYWLEARLRRPEDVSN